MARTVILVIVLAAPPIATIVGSRIYDRIRYPRRFAEVVPDAVYRGGFPTAEDLDHLKEDKSIRTIVNLTERTNRPEEKKMLDEAARLGIRVHQFPMPGDGRGDYAALDQAAAVIANRANWPLYFHCAAGKQRSNAAWAAYRMRHCGWSLEKALAELERDYDLDRNAERLLCVHLAGYSRWLSERNQNSTSAPRGEGK